LVKYLKNVKLMIGWKKWSWQHVTYSWWLRFHCWLYLYPSFFWYRT